MDTEAVIVFAAAAEASSLAAAARRLGLSPMLATRRLAALERDLGIRLMHRTTRSVSLTAEGEAFLPYAQAIVESEAAARASLRSASAGVSGLLRVTVSASFGRRVVAPLVPRLLRQNPDLRIDLELTDSVVDIVASGADLAIRIGRLRDNSLVARRLAPSPRLLCAAPSYLAERGTPKTIDDLARHECLVVTGMTHWPFEVAGKERRVRVAGRFTASSLEGLRSACLGGGGITLLAAWNARDEIRDGKLVSLTLSDARPEEQTIWAVYPSSRLVLPKQRLFIATLEAALRADHADLGDFRPERSPAL
ncbi:LysR family transcriptional regulator [Aliidongia dinghuensis]|uniref:LysR family transcriptional regulator n=1 Tax=Aliidongia dinghuensis TaxID=1867774 RepID=A0A8J2YQ83_9PROT|nr:LysR family transcriptional regulator [Aliidongia dinghuensis]GGF04629.1 LysR family transcriptional regulator [Aliidongia dinghuensis]